MSKNLTMVVIAIVVFACIVVNTDLKTYILPADAQLPDGGRYYGELKNNLFSGEGAIIWPEGSRYAGGFSKGLFSGYGKLYLDNGVVYKGQFEQGRYQGEGELEDASGNIYTGQFKEGEYHGQGEYITSEGNSYKGEFLVSKFTGIGEYADSESNHYKGSFKDWIYDGQGIYISEDGSRYEGTFIDGELTGEGSFHGEDGSTYTGNFDGWTYDGDGDLVTADGDHYQGEFKYGLYHGDGKLTYAKPKNGQTEQEGEWIYGSYAAEDNNKELNVEKVLYTQNQLLEETIDKILPTEKGKINLYFVGLGGDGKQDVFYKEVTTVQQVFDESLGTVGRSALLINNPETIDTIPLVTATSLERLLQGMSTKMDAEKDILFLYLSSHGSKDFKISLDQKGLDLPNLPAKQLAKILDELPIKWKVIVISACYAGGFINELENDHTMIITAAAKNRTSFGCSDDADMTYFGRAFFQDALLETDDFVATFDLATELVTKREKEEFPDSKHSNPQISKPQAIVEYLKLWRTQL